MLKGSQRKYLRGLAQGLRPVVQVGKGGLSPAVLDAVAAALEAHELVKVQIFAEREDRSAVAASIEQSLGCECVGSIGKMAVFYLEHPDPERRSISLPG